MTSHDTVECRYHGRDFTTSEMALLRALIAETPQQTRAALARQFCRAIGWVKPDGEFRFMSTRVALLRMHRDGLITLPPPRFRPGPVRTPRMGPETDPPQTPMPETLDAVRPIRFVMVTRFERAESAAWNGFIERWHYLGYTRMAGAQMRYIVEDRDGRPLAMLGFCAAAWKTGPRDAFIGWSPAVRERNLYRVINNARYLVLPWIRIPNLASHILSRVRRQLTIDWQNRYNISPALIETFVEIPRFPGTTYKASGWIQVGTTQGRGRYDTKKVFSKPQKQIWLCPLRKDWKRILNT